MAYALNVPYKEAAMWIFIPAAILFIAMLFSPLVATFWYLDRKNARASKAEGQAHLLSCIEFVDASALRAENAFEQGAKELVREADLADIGTMLVLSVRYAYACRTALQSDDAKESCDSLLEAAAFAELIDKTDMTSLNNVVRDMEGLCRLRRAELAAVDHGLHALPGILASYPEWLRTITERARTVGESHMNGSELKAVDSDIIDAVGEHALAGHFIEKLREAVFVGGSHSSEAAHAAAEARKAADKCVQAFLRVQSALSVAETASCNAPEFLSHARDRLAQLRFFREGQVSAVLLDLAERWLVLADAGVASGRPYEFRMANGHVEMAMKLIVLAESRTGSVTL